MRTPAPSHDRDSHHGTDTGAPGRAPVTARLAPRPLVFRVESAEAARELGAAFGPRDRNGVAAGADVAVDRAAESSGAPLPSSVKDQFEGSLGADLSSVRVHTGASSAEAASAVGARAYTTGQDIHFAAGQYAPSDPFGLHLLAHEVAHTVQQSGGAATTQYKLEVSTPGDSAEVEADRAADAMVSGAPASVSGASGVARAIIQRDKNTPAPGLSSLTGVDGNSMPTLGAALPQPGPVSAEEKEKINAEEKNFDAQMALALAKFPLVAAAQGGAVRELKDGLKPNEDPPPEPSILPIIAGAALGAIVGAAGEMLAEKVVEMFAEEGKGAAAAIKMAFDASGDTAGDVVKEHLGKENPTSVYAAGQSFFNAIEQSMTTEAALQQTAFSEQMRLRWNAATKWGLKESQKVTKEVTSAVQGSDQGLKAGAIVIRTKTTTFDQWCLALARGTLGVYKDKTNTPHGTDMYALQHGTAKGPVNGVLDILVKVGADGPFDPNYGSGGTYWHKFLEWSVSGMPKEMAKEGLQGRSFADVKMPKSIVALCDFAPGSDHGPMLPTKFHILVNEEGVVWLSEPDMPGNDWLCGRLDKHPQAITAGRTAKGAEVFVKEDLSRFVFG